MADKSDSEHMSRLTAGFKEWKKADMSKSSEELAKTLIKVTDPNLKRKTAQPIAFSYPFDFGIIARRSW